MDRREEILWNELNSIPEHKREFDSDVFNCILSAMQKYSNELREPTHDNNEFRKFYKIAKIDKEKMVNEDMFSHIAVPRQVVIDDIKKSIVNDILNEVNQLNCIEIEESSESSSISKIRGTLYVCSKV